MTPQDLHDLIGLADKAGVVAVLLIVMFGLWKGWLVVGRSAKEITEQLREDLRLSREALARKDEQLAAYKALVDGLAEASRRQSASVDSVLDFLVEVVTSTPRRRRAQPASGGGVEGA